MNHQHFDNKTAHEHIANVNSQYDEPHSDINTNLFSLCCKDACSTIFLISSLYIICNFIINIQNKHTFILTCLSSISFAIWKSFSSARAQHSYLEKINNWLIQEKHEIENHPEQEKEEVIAIYTEKGLEGSLLEDVANTFMADKNKLLKVMIEDELRLQLQSCEHPFRIGFYSFISNLSICTCLLYSITLNKPYVVISTAIILSSIASILLSKKIKTHVIPELIWNLAISCFAILTSYFLNMIIN